MPVRAECKPHSPDLKRGGSKRLTLDAVAFGAPCYRAPASSRRKSRVRDPLGELGADPLFGGVTVCVCVYEELFPNAINPF